MPETNTERGSESRESSSSSPDQSNRSERSDLGSGPSGSDGGRAGDQQVAGGTSPSGPESADLGPNGDDSRRLSGADASGQGPLGDQNSPDGRPSLAAHPDAGATQPDDGSARSQPEAHGASSQQDSNPAEAVAASGENASVNMSKEANYTPGPKAEANMSQGPKADAVKQDAPKQDAAKQDAAKQDGTKLEPGKSDGKQELKDAPNPQALTKQQISDILSKSTDLNDAKLNLGLGPVTDAVLADYLIAHGFGSSPSEPSGGPAAPKYDGPSIGPDRGGISYDQYQANQKAALDALAAERSSVLAAVGGGIAAASGGDAQDINRAAQAGKLAGSMAGNASKATSQSQPTTTGPSKDNKM